MTPLKRFGLGLAGVAIGVACTVTGGALGCAAAFVVSATSHAYDNDFLVGFLAIVAGGFFGLKYGIRFGASFYVNAVSE